MSTAIPETTFRPHKRKSRLPWILLTALAFIIGIVMGAATSSSSPTAAPEPAPTVTETKQVTPVACSKALDYADQALTLAGTGFEASADAMRAMTQGDYAAVQAATEKIQSVNSELDRISPEYKAAKVNCIQE